MSENPKYHTWLSLLNLTIDYKSPYIFFSWLTCVDFLEELIEDVVKE